MRTLRPPIKVFLASPNDLSPERGTFGGIIGNLNDGFGRGAGVRFVALGWEDLIASVGPRPQDVINKLVDACHIFILAMWERWGQKADATNSISSYTEEEFYRALARFKNSGAPRIHVLFKAIDTRRMAKPNAHTKKVLAFRRQLEDSRKVLYRVFRNKEEFAKEIERHLIAFVEDESVPSDLQHPATTLESLRAEIDRLKEGRKHAEARLERAEATIRALRTKKPASSAMGERNQAAIRKSQSNVAEAKADVKSLDLAERAARAALGGRIEEARQTFAKALDGTTSLSVLYLAFEFFRRLGELEEAKRLAKRWLAISGPNARTAGTAAALGSLGLIAMARGDLDDAEWFCRKSLAINRKLGRLSGQANQLNNLGLLAHDRGNLKRAEKLLRESLEINRGLKQLGMVAAQLGNIGLVAQARGNLDAAEKLHHEALAIFRKLKLRQGEATQFENLGSTLQARGDLSGAAALYRKALKIEDKLNWRVGRASTLGKLGQVALAQGDLPEAEKLFHESLGMELKLGSREGRAIQLGNLGSAALQRGSVAEARRFWTESLDLYVRTGMPLEVKKMRASLDSLPQNRKEWEVGRTLGRGREKV